MLAEVWRGLGFWTLYFLASLQSIPDELLDAARVDGAKGFQRFRRVTLPLLRPMLLFAVVIAIIANFQVFDTVYVLTQGGPHRVDLDARLVHLEAAVPVPGDRPGVRRRRRSCSGSSSSLTAISFWLLGTRGEERAA